MLVEKNFTVDVSEPEPVIIHAVQGDSMRSVVLTLQKDGAAYNPESDLASGESIKGAVLCNKPDGKRVAYEKASWQASGAKAVTKVSAGKYRAYFDDQCFAAAGHATIYVRLYAVKSGVNTGKILHTFAITAAVEKNPAASIESKDYINLPSQAEIAATVARAVLYDPQTTFSSTEKKVARNNIEASNRRIWANVWSKDNTYNYGDYVIYSDWLYRYVKTTPGNGADANGNFKPKEDDGVTYIWFGSTFASVIPKLVRNDIDQKFNTSQKYKARENIDAARKGYIASAYSSSATYQVGDWAMVVETNRDVIMQCTVAITTPEAYNPEHWSSGNKSVGNTIADILRRLANVEPSDEDDEGSGEVVLENNFVYCDFDIPSATTLATETEVSASAFYPIPTKIGDIVFGRNGKLAEVTDLTYDPNDASVLMSAKVSGILDRFSGRDDLTEAYAEQQTYSSITAFLAHQPTGKYVVTSGSGATFRIYYADNTTINNIPVSKIASLASTSVSDYVYINGTLVSTITYNAANGTTIDGIPVANFVKQNDLKTARQPRIFLWVPQAPGYDLPGWGETGDIILSSEAEFKSFLYPKIDPNFAISRPQVGDVLIQADSQDNGLVALITGIDNFDEEPDPQQHGYWMGVSGFGYIRDVGRQPQIFVYTPSAEENELPASGSVTIGTNSPLKDYLNPSIDPVVGDILFDRYNCNIARISGTIDAEVGDGYETDVTGIGTLLDYRIPAAPSTDGTYTLTATVTNGEVTYSWT